jgi:hypothetical protein
VIFNWFKKRRKEHLGEQKKIMEGWQKLYFSEITFPILIISGKEYLGVHDLDEYCGDEDIHRFFVKEQSEGIDAESKIFDFQKINPNQWVPQNKKGFVTFEELRNKVQPLLYMPIHEREFSKAKSVRDIIELILKKE